MTQSSEDLWDALLDEAIARADAVIAARRPRYDKHGGDPLYPLVQCSHEGIGLPECDVCDKREQ